MVFFKYKKLQEKTIMNKKYINILHLVQIQYMNNVVIWHLA